jgi:hypothetical protein
MTPMGEVAAYGTMARGIRARSGIAGRLVGVLFLLLILGSVLFGALGWFLFDDDPDPAPERPTVPTSIVPAPLPSLPPPPVPPAS